MLSHTLTQPKGMFQPSSAAVQGRLAHICSIANGLLGQEAKAWPWYSRIKKRQQTIDVRSSGVFWFFSGQVLKKMPFSLNTLGPPCLPSSRFAHIHSPIALPYCNRCTAVRHPRCTWCSPSSQAVTVALWLGSSGLVGGGKDPAAPSVQPPGRAGSLQQVAQGSILVTL